MCNTILFLISSLVNVFDTGSGSFDIENEHFNPREYSVSITELPDGHVAYQPKKGAMDGSFSFESDEYVSRYNLCFANHARDDDEDSVLTVGFSLRISQPIRAMDEEEFGPETEKAFLLMERAMEIHEEFSVMLDHLDYAHNREAAYEKLGNAILYRLSKWTYIEALLVVGMSTAQVMYWKKFFETTRYL